MNVYVQRLADDLCSLGMTVDVFTRRTDTSTPEIVLLESGARIIHLSAGPPRQLPKSALPLHIPAMVSEFRSFVSHESLQYDIVHSHYWLSGLVALRLRPITAAPIVHMFHTLSKVKELYTGQPDPSDTALRFAGERSVISGADAIVGATEAELEQIEKLYGRSPARFEVIPPGVDMSLFRPYDKEESRARLALRGGPLVLFVGRPDRLKGLDILLRAVAELAPSFPHLRVVLVGGQEGVGRDHASRAHRLAQRLGVEDRLDFRGVVQQKQLPLYYAAADLCAVPSAYESFGMVAVESLSSETPVVAFPVGGLMSTVRDGQSGFLAENRTGAGFTEALRQALCATDLDAMGRRGRLSVQRYNWQGVARASADLYTQLAAEQHCWCERLSGVG